ncbi:type I restriction endonuclease subunit M [Halorubrum ezzemoulense DSM 17463]|uniref:site-specific DNA-methyltransferase (adenine-specific) n=1 Tax=Halorubrum ezzemoulense DSM 17463 TaxID=1121945 RepID=A0A1X4H7T0_HALEZ|nr:class I SAM-dependent DNA methyltransferase [Halorubrum ezzemoulense]OSP07320.1 type I restriction endonuclease subunit M [Halorubrum ezzemoulense DSM 17463]
MASKDESLLQYTEGGETLELDTLESHLWEAADILRGSIDAADYKNYIFGLLFLKRINDRFEEETSEIAEELTGDDEEPDEDLLEQIRGDRDLHEEFWVPERARWGHIAAQSSDIGATLNKALEAVEDENDAIADRVLTSVDFNDKDRLADSTLEELVTHFSKHRYRNADLEDPDIFGRAYEYLIRQFADDAGKKGGEFYTPREVVQLLVECVDPGPGDRVYDPACGSGGMLVYSAQHVEDEGGDRDDISLYGQEKNLNTWAIGQMNVLLHELQDANIAKGDTITEPKFITEHGELEVFDRVVANPPWNQKKWNAEWVGDNEPYNRFTYGLPPKNRGDWTWVQLMLASLSETGKAGIVMDNGLLFRSRSEKKIRRPIIEDDLIESVIALPENLFYNTSSPGCIVILNKDKPEEREGKIQFIYAEDEELRESGVRVFEELSSQNRLTSEGVGYIAETYLTGREEDHHSRLVDIQEIEENDWNLSVPRYVDTTAPEESIDVSQKLDELDKLKTERQRTDEQLNEYMEELDYR